MVRPVPPCPGPGLVGPDCWREATMDIVRMARELSHKSGRTKSAPWHASRPKKGITEDLPCPIKEAPASLPSERKALPDVCDFIAEKIPEKSAPEEEPLSRSKEWSKRLRGPPWLTKLPLPFFRDFILMQNNSLMQDYAKETREVVAHLREAFIQTNDELTRLLKAKEELDHTHANIRKDMLVSKQSLTIRSFRPKCEKLADKADCLMSSERAQLLTLKNKLEAELLLAQEQLQELASCRRSLSECTQERTRVLDLVTHCLSTVLRDNETEALLSSNPMAPKKGPIRWGGEKNATPKADPLGCFTPDCKAALEAARCATQRSKKLRREIKEVVAEVVRLQREIDHCINVTLKKKMKETQELAGLMHLTKGDLRTSIHRCQRLYDEMERTYGLALGPEASGDMLVTQRLERPQVQIHQRHPGSQLPETITLTKGCRVLKDAMKTASDDISLLHVTRLHLEDNLRDKNMAFRADSNTLRLRRRRAPHRWTMDEGKQLIPD
ncbi:tektin-like protein 1 [Ambystoma mexicanum]|uniref:tektin-like protein 1 n=1 Tax=Ambystoma mexicanum TaxID=8296 RepID=UPI0037E73B8C